MEEIIERLNEAANNANSKELCPNCITVLLHLFIMRKEKAKKLFKEIEKMYNIEPKKGKYEKK